MPHEEGARGEQGDGGYDPMNAGSEACAEGDINDATLAPETGTDADEAVRDVGAKILRAGGGRVRRGGRDRWWSCGLGWRLGVGEWLGHGWRVRGMEAMRTITHVVGGKGDTRRRKVGTNISGGRAHVEASRIWGTPCCGCRPRAR